MCLLKKITYGEFSEFIPEKKITYKVHTKVQTPYTCTQTVVIVQLDGLILDN